MKRRKLETSEDKSTQRGAKKGDVRNPTGTGGFQKGVSGNPSGRPVGSGNKVPQIESIWDCWKKSNALGWLFCSLNYKLPLSLFENPGNLSPDELREIRSLLIKNFWRGMDFIRKTCASKIGDELDIADSYVGLAEISAELRAKASGKLVDIEVKRRAAK